MTIPSEASGVDVESLKRDVEALWIDHLGLLPGDPSVATTFNAVNSGVGSGLSGLVIQSSTLGDEANGGGNKVVWTALEVPLNLTVVGVRVGKRQVKTAHAKHHFCALSLFRISRPRETQ